jgi:cellulose synthase/poly-beta-1,6-N-acetylglucosamine synthase-like glycosyltransferase
MEQDYPSVELIVIDSASNDRTVELVRQFTKDHKIKVRLVREKQRKGKASALNLVFSKYCSGEIIAITDADAIWEKDTLRKLVSSFSDSSIGAVTGRQVLLNTDQKSAAKLEKAYRSVFDVLRVGETILDSTPIFNGPLMAFRSSLLEPIPEDTIADDSHLAVEIRRKGFRSVYNSDALFYEYVPPTLTYPMIIAVLIVAITIIALATVRIGVTDFILTFLDSQFILLIALGYQLTGRSQHRWKKVPEVGKLVREARAKSPP